MQILAHHCTLLNRQEYNKDTSIFSESSVALDTDVSCIVISAPLNRDTLGRQLHSRGSVRAVVQTNVHLLLHMCVCGLIHFAFLSQMNIHGPSVCDRSRPLEDRHRAEWETEADAAV